MILRITGGDVIGLDSIMMEPVNCMLKISLGDSNKQSEKSVSWILGSFDEFFIGELYDQITMQSVAWKDGLEALVPRDSTHDSEEAVAPDQVRDES